MLQLKRLVDAKLQINVISSSTTLHETRDEVGRAAMTDSHAVALFHPSFRIAIYRSLATATLLYNVYAGWTLDYNKNVSASTVWRAKHAKTCSTRP